MRWCCWIVLILIQRNSVNSSMPGPAESSVTACTPELLSKKTLTTRSSDFVWIWDKRIEDKRIEIVTSLDELTQCSPGSTERIEFLK